MKVIKVVSKETNKIIEIKDSRFNPEFHKHIDDMTPEEAPKDEAKEETIAPESIVEEEETTPEVVEDTVNVDIPNPILPENGFYFNGKTYKTEAAMKAAITRSEK